MPAVFPDSTPHAVPTVIFVAGQVGSGRTRVIGGLAAQHPADLAVVSGDGLRAFHPRYLAAVRSGDLEAQRTVAEETSPWFAACLRHARAITRSLVIEGAFPNPSTVVSTAGVFANDGFQTRVVVVGVSRAESVMGMVSAHLTNVRDGIRTPFPGVELHDRGWDGTRGLVAMLEESADADQLTILDRTGRVVFDEKRSDAQPRFAGAVAALERAQERPMSPLEAAQWMSELRRVTEFAADHPDAEGAVTGALIELYEIGVRDVLPALAVPQGSQVVARQQRQYVDHLTRLRHSLRPAAPRFAPAPVPVTPTPDRGGISR
ncbi:zeta toxin family protein [Microbacterium thalassium]|uniref:zeta toxin family protein n=1 Tax=Microbacterium thalassium TaxID=362649 RepID=UPI0022F2664E|nr:zeta toxin family protein [Microbacterium thalassium]